MQALEGAESLPGSLMDLLCTCSLCEAVLCSAGDMWKPSVAATEVDCVAEASVASRPNEASSHCGGLFLLPNVGVSFNCGTQFLLWERAVVVVIPGDAQVESVVLGCVCDCRDVSPDNMVVVPEPDGSYLAYLLDLHVARRLSDHEEEAVMNEPPTGKRRYWALRLSEDEGRHSLATDLESLFYRYGVFCSWQPSAGLFTDS